MEMISPAAMVSMNRVASSPQFLQSSSLLSPFSLSSISSFPPHRIPSFALQFLRRPLAAVCSLPDDVDLAQKHVRFEPSLAVKKKASEVSADLKGTSIFLVGMNNAMKTSVGKVLADALRYYYFDSDNLVEEAAGREDSGKSFRKGDEDGFRESETEVLKQLSSMGRLVVSAGNGAVQSSTNLALLRHGISIWIDVPLDVIAKCIIEDGNQIPISTDSFSEVLDQLNVVYNENRGGYSTADATVSLQKVASELACDDFDQVTAEDMALEVLKELEKLTRVKKMMQEAGKPF